MLKPPEFDVKAAHKYFAAHCFNAAWDLMRKTNRTPEEDRMMAALSGASIYHWRMRDDCDNRRLSIGYWQASRIQALLGNAAEAVRFGEMCLGYSHELPPFYLGYAHEALARAHRLAGNAGEWTKHQAAAEECAARVTEDEDRKVLVADLDELKTGASG